MSILAKIIYDAGAGPVTLAFQRPARHVSGGNLEAIRHDNIASSGVKEAIHERTEEFLEFEMEWVGLGTDEGDWRSFFDYALAGGAFDFYPDSDVASFTTYTLEATSYNSTYKTPGQYSFTTKFRKEVPWP